MEMDDEAREILAANLEHIDTEFASADVPLEDRPARAASFMIEYELVSADRVAKAEYWLQPWFGLIYREIMRWFESRYGEALRRAKRKNDYRRGLVLILGCPFALRIPVTIWTPDEEGETGWLHFPNEVRPGEEPTSWIEGPPNLKNLAEEARRATDEAISEVVRLTRSVFADLLFVHPRTDAFKELASTLHAHVEKAIGDILSVEAARMATGMWELHLTMEKALKGFLAQRAHPFQRTHSLKDLYAAATAAGLPELGSDVVAALPAAQVSIGRRYGRGPKLSVEEAYNAYMTTMRVVRHCTSHLKRRAGGWNLGVQIRRLPWRF